VIQNRLCDILDHILEAARQACSYVEGMNKEQFLADKRTQQAVTMNLVIIGEAATKLLQEYGDFINRHPGVSWRHMKGMRNRLAHGYFAIDLDVVWETVQTALPELREQLSAVRKDAMHFEVKGQGMES
jgi:uncharacterized protein with HEPN domain